ncbi:MAG TPA: ATP-binding protein [Verrucomicrobiae bacterium]|nr:ATP-binding protein [Verrucomicrobiae bacterium]
MSGKVPSFEERVLIVAPTGNDAANAAEVLAKEGMDSRVCSDLPELCQLARSGVGTLLLTQESLTTHSLNHLALLLDEQPPWSDIPVILLASGGEATAPGLNSLRALGSSSTITVLERPLRVVTLVSAIKTGLRARRRQYQVRDLIHQRELIMGELSERAKSLEYSQRELLQAKEKISRHAEELEKTVEERTAKLRETIAQLEAFSYSISHDMRGPLRAMQQYSQILLEECRPGLSSDACHYLDRIARGAQRLDRLIQDVLTYSRVARASMPLVPINLDKLVRDILQQYPSFQPPRANVEVIQPLPVVLGHEASLTQCISNLIANAVKFVPPDRRPTVHVKTGTANGSVQVWFEDNGIGIAPENHQRIFNIFERVNSDAEFEGTGIGLSIVKKTIERMGGEVGVESELGRGSRFWIRLPTPHHEQHNTPR